MSTEKGVRLTEEEIRHVVGATTIFNKKDTEQKTPINFSGFTLLVNIEIERTRGAIERKNKYSEYLCDNNNGKKYFNEIFKTTKAVEKLESIDLPAHIKSKLDEISDSAKKIEIWRKENTKSKKNIELRHMNTLFERIRIHYSRHFGRDDEWGSWDPYDSEGKNSKGDFVAICVCASEKLGLARAAETARKDVKSWVRENQSRIKRAKEVCKNRYPSGQTIEQFIEVMDELEKLR